MNESPRVIEARNLTKRFTAPTLIEAVRGVNLALGPGEMVALVGPSGSGKSTLLSLLGGLLTPSAGEISLRGTPLTSLSRHERTRVRNLDVGFVFQFHHLLAELTALENVMLPALIAAREGWRPAELPQIRDAARGLLEQVGLGGRLDHFPTQLSGGEAQRAAIARALINSPAVVLADEPTGNLDRKTAQSIIELFADMNKRAGCGLLIATHNAELVTRSSRSLHLVAGELRE